MNAMKTIELPRKYNQCEKCGSTSIGNGAGTLEVTEDTFTRTCKCGWSIEVSEASKPLEVGRQYFDSRGQVYFVRAGLGENQFKAFYRKPDKSPGYGEHGCRNMPWRETVDEAQRDLDALALRKKWKEIVQSGE